MGSWRRNWDLIRPGVVPNQPAGTFFWGEWSGFPGPYPGSRTNASVGRSVATDSLASGHLDPSGSAATGGTRTLDAHAFCQIRSAVRGDSVSSSRLQVLDAGNDLDRAAALTTRFDVDLEYPPETLGPRHGGAALGGGLGLKEVCSPGRTGVTCWRRRLYGRRLHGTGLD